MLRAGVLARDRVARPSEKAGGTPRSRSEEHTSELQSQSNLVCRLLLEKKKTEISRPLSASPRLTACAPSAMALIPRTNTFLSTPCPPAPHSYPLFLPPSSCVKPLTTN